MLLQLLNRQKKTQRHRPCSWWVWTLCQRWRLWRTTEWWPSEGISHVPRSWHTTYQTECTERSHLMILSGLPHVIFTSPSLFSHWTFYLCLPLLCQAPTHKPVISTAGLISDGGVHFVSDKPMEICIGEQSDLFFVRSSQVGTASMKISKEHHILQRRQRIGQHLSATLIYITCK